MEAVDNRNRHQEYRRKQRKYLEARQGLQQELDVSEIF